MILRKNNLIKLKRRMPGGGVEPPTQGFSVPRSTY